MRARLAGFAREGVRVGRDSDVEGDSDSPEEEEVTELTALDEKRKSTPQKMDVDLDEPEVGNDGQTSMDVVNETMAIDSSESEDEPLKPPNDISRAAATASPTSPRTDDDLTSNAELSLHSPSEPSDDTPSGSADAVSPSSFLNVSVVRTEVIRTTVGDSPPIVFDLERITKAWSTYLERRSTAQTLQPAPRSSELESADLGADDENATAALARVLSKADFGSMDVVGQFNRGFIVARLCKAGEEGATDDLFIIDQHAADEKYNFETLQATTRLESQRLFSCVVTFALIYSDSKKGMGDTDMQSARAGADSRR
jgi:DNA mismatch repair protein PMS2